MHREVSGTSAARKEGQKSRVPVSTSPETAAADPPPGPDLVALLEPRIGRVHCKQRIGIQRDHSDQIFGQGRKFFHIENWDLAHRALRVLLRISGLYGRGQRNARRLQIRHHEVDLAHLPRCFNGFTILQVSDLHVDGFPDLVDVLIGRLEEVEYDLAVLTGDFRYNTRGPIEPAMDGMRRVRSHLRDPVFGVLGNHDFLDMVPVLEGMGIRMLLNESVLIEREGEALHLVGVDDPHFYETHNLEKATSGVPPEAVSILLSHSPELFKLVGHADIDLMLCGHTHGGQVCLPGPIALIDNADCPRRYSRGPWSYHDLRGYTSVGSGASGVDVRFNCLPEITLHHLRAVPSPFPAGN